jgi:hypothetical protein
MHALALPLALIVKEYNVIPATGWTDYNAIGPAKQNHIGQSIVWVGIEQDRIAQGLWLV